MKYSILLKIAFLLLSVSSITQWCTLPIGNTFIWWCLKATILFVFFRYYYFTKRKYDRIPLLVFVSYAIIFGIYGLLFQTENYWDYKNLVSNMMVFLLPMASYLVNKKLLFAKIIRFWVNYSWLLFLLLAPFLESDAFGRFLVPYTFLALMLRIDNIKTIVLIIIAYFITVILGQESRSDIIKFTMSICLGITFLIPFVVKKAKMLSKCACVMFFIAPLFFLFLALTGIFNIFEIEQTLGVEDKYTMKSSVSDNGEVSALSDTRTFLYAEELSSAINHNYWLFGRSPARGYESQAFGFGIDEELHTNRNERASCEVSMLNVFNYFGLVGIVLYTAIFISASYNAIWRSKNIYIKIIGIYVSFRWLYGFVEDFTIFDLNMTFLWLMVGMCYSQQFRNFSDKEFKRWFQVVIRPVKYKHKLNKVRFIKEVNVCPAN